MGYYYRLIGNISFLLHLLLYTINAQNSEGDVRLQSGSNIFEGRIEIYHSNEWTTVCLDNFDITDANVVCLQLFQESAISVVAGSQFGAGSSDDSLIGVACTDSDTTLQSCTNSGYSNTCSNNHAGVSCQFPGYFGCYTNAVITALQGALYTGRTDLTITDCIESCRDESYTYSGTINGEQCSCGNTIEVSPGDDSVVPETFCNVACSGDSTEFCGGDGYTSIYISSIGQDGGTYTSTEGYIYTPNFPAAYLGESVSWMVTFENPTFTAVTIRMFDLSTDDELVLTSGTGDLMETHRGSDSLALPYVWETDLTGSFEVQLTSSTMEARNGFFITYEAITGSCGGDFTGTSGYIASPNYPDDAPSSSSCMYTITAPENYIIIITVEQRLLPSGTSLSLVDNGAIMGVTTTGMFGPSTTNVMHVNFMSGTTSSASTFLIKYTASQGPCDAFPTIPFGTLDSSVSGTVYPPKSVTFTCDSGYASADTVVMCMEDGSWSSAECIVLCNAVPTVAFGSVDTGNRTEFHPNDQVMLTCNNGYTESPSVIMCLDDGSWTPAECIENPATTAAATTPAATTVQAPDSSTAAPGDSTTATMPATTPPPSTTIMTPVPATAEPNGPTDAEPTTVAKTTQAPPISTTEDALQPNSDLCRVTRDPIMESFANTEDPNVLALNVGNPLDCQGYLTGIEIFSSDTSTVTISVLRFVETNKYQLIGRFDVVGQTSMVVTRDLHEDDWIKFESGDMIGTSSTSSSPLTYSEDQAESVDYMIWDLSVDEEFHTSDVGNMIELMNTNDRPSRTYSWAVFITENVTCAKPDIDNAAISPESDVYNYQDIIEVECDDDYTPSQSTTLMCRVDGTFDSFTCNEKDRKTFFIIIGLVCVGILGILVVIVIVMMACIKEEELPTRIKPKRSTFASTGSGRSDNSQRFLIPIEDDGGRDKVLAVSNPLPVVDERPGQLSDPEYPPIDYPQEEEEAIQAIDEAVLGFDNLSFDSAPIDTRSGGDSARHHVTFSDRR